MSQGAQVNARKASTHDRGDFSALPPDPMFSDITATDVNLADLASFAEIVAGFTSAETPKTAPAHVTERQSAPLSALCEMIFTEKATLKTKTKGDYKNAVAWLVQIVGDMPVCRVKEDDLLKFKDKLLATPSNFEIHLETDNILEAIKRNARLEKKQRNPLMSYGTINNKYQSALVLQL